MAAAVLVIAGPVGCAPRCPDAGAAPPTSGHAEASPAPPAFDPAAPLCDSLLAQDVPHTTPCRLIGVYALNIHMSKVGTIQDAWPAVFREGVGWVLLESLWYPEKRPSPSTIARYEGKYVEVYGIPHYTVPASGPENYVHLPCIAPVHAIRVLERAPHEGAAP